MSVMRLRGSWGKGFPALHGSWGNGFTDGVRPPSGRHTFREGNRTGTFSRAAHTDRAGLGAICYDRQKSMGESALNWIRTSTVLLVLPLVLTACAAPQVAASGPSQTPSAENSGSIGPVMSVSPSATKTAAAIKVTDQGLLVLLPDTSEVDKINPSLEIFTGPNTFPRPTGPQPPVAKGESACANAKNSRVASPITSMVGVTYSSPDDVSNWLLYGFDSSEAADAYMDTWRAYAQSCPNDPQSDEHVLGIKPFESAISGAVGLSLANHNMMIAKAVGNVVFETSSRVSQGEAEKQAQLQMDKITASK